PEARVVGDYREILDDPSITAVAVVLPSHLHHRVGMDVLNAGKHLLMEKPMGISEGECDDLVRTARERGLCLAVGHEMRLSGLWGKAKEMIDAGAIGRPLYVLIEL